MKIYDYHGSKNVCGPYIKSARQKLGISQTELAEQMKENGILIEQNSISRIEIGTRFVPDYELIVLSKILNVSVNDLLGINT